MCETLLQSDKTKDYRVNLRRLLLWRRLLGPVPPVVERGSKQAALVRSLCLSCCHSEVKHTQTRHKECLRRLLLRRGLLLAIKTKERSKSAVRALYDTGVQQEDREAGELTWSSSSWALSSSWSCSKEERNCKLE